MNNTKRVNRLHHYAKGLFLAQGLLLLAVGTKDLTSFKFSDSTDVQCARIVNITWLVVGFATVHLISGVFTFFYSCTNTVYEPLICFVLWSICINGLVFYHLKQLFDFEQILSTNLAISLAIVTTAVLLMLAELILHVNILCLQERDIPADKNFYQLMIMTSQGI